MKVIKYILLSVGIIVLSSAGGFIGGKLTNLGKPVPHYVRNINEEQSCYIQRIKELLLYPKINRDSIFLYLRKLQEIRCKRESIRLSNFIKKIEPLYPEQRIKYLRKIGPRPIKKRCIKTRRIK